MNKDDEILTRLPHRRTGRRVEWLATKPIWLIGIIGFTLYILIILVVSGVEWCLSGPGRTWVKAADGTSVGMWDVVYFNFVSILTIGYGDYSPNGVGARITTIFEAFIGTGILGISLAALTAKFLSPPNDAIVFSRYAYYCTEDEKFLVIYLNTTQSRLVNAEISSYFKLGGDWHVRPSVRSPFVTRAVQTFFTDSVAPQDLANSLNEASDAFRFGISGQLGATSFSTAIEYKPVDIIVIPNRSALISFAGFWKPNLKSQKFQEMFHYHPSESQTLMEYVEKLRQSKLD
jgi:hypothetical protein